MTTQKFNKKKLTYRTSKGTGAITLTRENGENVAEIKTAMINNISFKFHRFAVQDGKVGILVNLKEVSKALPFPSISKDVILEIVGHSKLETIYNMFSETTYSGNIVKSGFGFNMKDTKRNWEIVHQQGVRMITNGMNEDLMTSVFSKLPGFEITINHPIIK